ncbi:unnamed protein product [Chrysoparadoxa australica]
MSAEDIFNIFFGAQHAGGGMRRNGMGTAGFRVHRGGFRMPNQRAQQQQNGGGQRQAHPWQLIQLLPLAIMLLYSFFSFPASDPVFSLNQNRNFSVQRATRSTHGVVEGIPYFVKKDFEVAYGRDRYQLRQVEKSVTARYRDLLQNKCHLGKQRKHELIQNAQRIR